MVGKRTCRAAFWLCCSTPARRGHLLPAWKKWEALLEGPLDERYEATPDVLLQFWHTLSFTEARWRVSECGTEC